jgi:CRISPR-associated protein (TIGR03986 family)
MPLPHNIDAPYNFVPLAKWVYSPDWASRVSHDLPFRDGLGGHLDLTITAHSPLLVGRDRQAGEEACDAHPGEVHPYQLPDGRYALPGTALKGMLRNVVEIATFSRMALVDDQRLGVRDLTPGARSIYGNRMTEETPRGSRIFRPKTKSGWLFFDTIDNSWRIEPCLYARVEHEALVAYHGVPWVTLADRPTARVKYDAWFRPLDIAFTDGPEEPHQHSRGNRLVYRRASNLGAGATMGTLVFTGQPNYGNHAKHLEFIFFGSTGAPIRVPDDVFRGFLDIHDQKTENAPQSQWDEWRNQARVPVFYLEDDRPGTVASLGLAMMYKLAYSHSLHAAIRNTSPRHLDEQALDMATLLFGRVGEKPEDCLRGRVSIQHAVAEGNPVPQAMDPTILNGPKPTYYPNYIQQPRAQNNRIPANQGYRTLMENGCELRGWKRYPARQQIEPQLLTAAQAQHNPVQVCLHPLPADTTFSTRVTFHNLRPVELGALCWALTWGGQPELRHGLGMGKPFGYGQVSIAIDGADMTPNNPKASPLRWEACVDAFVEHMDAVHGAAPATEGTWRTSDAIRTLLAMADPRVQPANGSQLRHMQLTTENENDFKDAKMARLVLADYPRSTHPPLWGEVEAARIAEEQRIQRETAEREEAERLAREQAQAAADFAARPPEEKLLITTEKEIEKFLAMDEPECRNRQRRAALNEHLNRLANEASAWQAAGYRNQAADLLEATYDNAKVGWPDPGLDKKKRQKQEKKRRDKIAEIRAGADG